MDRSQNPRELTRRKLPKTIPSMRFTCGDFNKWQLQARQKLTELLGYDYDMCDDMFEIEYIKEYDSFKETRFTFQSEEGYFVPCHLLCPHDANNETPLVICLQGHSTGMHISLGRTKYDKDENLISSGDRAFAVGVLKRGYCALTIEQRGMGECGSREDGEPECQRVAMADIIMGKTIIGDRVWDVTKSIDICEKYFSGFFDKDNIICLGNSGGGTTTFYTACLDERIKTAIVSCALCGYDASIGRYKHCTCNYIPNIKKYFDMGDLGGLIAPRNLIVVSGEKDVGFPIDSAKQSFEITKSLYSHTDGKCIHVIGNEGHRFYYDLAWNAYENIMKEGM